MDMLTWSRDIKKTPMIDEPARRKNRSPWGYSSAPASYSLSLGSCSSFFDAFSLFEVEGSGESASLSIVVDIVSMRPISPLAILQN